MGSAREVSQGDVKRCEKVRKGAKRCEKVRKGVKRREKHDDGPRGTSCRNSIYEVKRVARNSIYEVKRVIFSNALVLD